MAALSVMAQGSAIKFYGCLKSLPVGLSEVPDLSALRGFFNNSQRDDRSNKCMVR